MNSKKSNTPVGTKILGGISPVLIRGFFLEKSDGLCLPVPMCSQRETIRWKN